MFRDRTTGDLLILIITGIIGSAVVLGIVLIGVVALFRPGTDTSAVGGTITSVISILIGLLAGFLAGRTDAHLSITRDRIEASRTASPASPAEGTPGGEPDHE